MKVALYARVSSAEEKQFPGPETQLLFLRNYYRSAGPEDGEIFVDHRSGKDSDGRGSDRWSSPPNGSPIGPVGHPAARLLHPERR